MAGTEGTARKPTQVENRPEANGVEPTHREIAQLAHQYWLERKDAEGSPEEDWFRALEELRRRKASQRP